MRLLLSAAALFVASGFAGGEDGGEFAACLSELEARAHERGLSASVVQAALGSVEYQPRVIELDRDQPEFRQSFSAYFRARVNANRVRRGRKLLRQHREMLARLTREYGVPGRYLVAFWGMETNFGGHLGNMPTLDSLATLACDPRRSDFFTEELMTALELVERESLAPADLRGSWAGAMGHTQFMPSAYLEHAIDGDGDGRVDLWNSEADALASAANYLAALGWQRGERWGREVRLPGDFAYSASGFSRKAPLAQWREMGVQRADGGELPVADMEGAVIVPMGHRGPAFLVYDNFEVIMQWNRSQAYAIAVGHLADRIAGAGRLVSDLPAVESAPSRTQLISLQRGLIELGFDPGEPDGVLGPVTRAALRDFQGANGLVADGYPDEATLEAVREKLPDDKPTENETD